ncbi:unnamed protein product [Prorocentrum cordatum]|uniref:RNA helicase n=1 Tax=Prorocentrum cordatum TaxID=2364126 RepID=A0ABN9RMA3_9DINO|nr:unnamed protein product [Polarella glacialis]
MPNKRAAEGAGAGEDVEGDEALGNQKQLPRAMARLLLQHEGHRRAHARDDNIVMEIAEDSSLQTLLDKAEECYDEMGKSARKAPDFQGHPEGKRPDAMMRSILQRLARVVQEGQAVLGPTIAQLPDPGEQEEWGAKAASPAGRELRATRCFHLPPNSEDKVRWIFALKAEPKVEAMFQLFRATQCLKPLDISFQFDHALESKAAKKVKELAFGGGKKEGRGPKKAKKR